jgi:hypothetical protein
VAGTAAVDQPRRAHATAVDATVAVGSAGRGAPSIARAATASPGGAGVASPSRCNGGMWRRRRSRRRR